VTGAINGSVGFAPLNGVDGRLKTDGATMYSSTPVSSSSFNIPTTSSVRNDIVPI
jgi:hypothetical protein